MTLGKRSPMTAEQQLERSVLEGKERDELNAIAQAMSLKTTTRTTKADIIDQILHATGVTSGSNGNGAAPAETAVAVAEVPAPPAAADDAASGSAEPAAPADRAPVEAAPAG